MLLEKKISVAVIVRDYILYPLTSTYCSNNLLPTHIPTHHWAVHTSACKLACPARVVFTFLKGTESWSAGLYLLTEFLLLYQIPVPPSVTISNVPFLCDTLSNSLLRQLLLPQCSLGPGSSFYFWHLLYCHYEFQGLHLCPPRSIIIPDT